ncbi:hypothetical protein HZA55_00555 [Candidatus Poribacteria bacterium]|nr:hypothetical protein [Candidatus Poribacteria bacterium]
MGMFNILESESLLDTPHVLEIVNNMSHEERKTLKKITIKYLCIVIAGFIVSAILFIYMLRNSYTSFSVKLALVFGFLSFGFCLSKITTYFIVRKQRKFLESTQYARRHGLEID